MADDLWMFEIEDGERWKSGALDLASGGKCHGKGRTFIAAWRKGEERAAELSRKERRKQTRTPSREA